MIRFCLIHEERVAIHEILCRAMGEGCLVNPDKLAVQEAGYKVVSALELDFNQECRRLYGKVYLSLQKPEGK